MSRTPAVAYEMFGDQADWLREKELEFKHEIKHLIWIIRFGRRPYVCEQEKVSQKTRLKKHICIF